MRNDSETTGVREVDADWTRQEDDCTIAGDFVQALARKGDMNGLLSAARESIRALGELGAIRRLLAVREVLQETTDRLTLIYRERPPLMHRECAWCGKELGKILIDEPERDGQKTHGACPACAKTMRKEIAAGGKNA